MASGLVPSVRAGATKPEGAAALRYFRFANWSRLQHYADRNPPWAKIYACILDPENDWYTLTDSQSGQLVRIVALACRRENTMPFSGELIADEIHASDPVDLEVFRRLGIIEVLSSRSQCLQLERDRLASRPSSRAARVDASGSASGDASGNASGNALLREQSTDSENRGQTKKEGSGLPVSSEGILGTETEQRSLPASTDADAGAVSSLLDREAGKESRWNEWIADLLRLSDDEPDLIRGYVEALDRAASDHYGAKGGKWTPTRKAKTADGMAKYHPDAQLAAVEIWVDRWSNAKDERYLVGIARRLSRLSDPEFIAEVRRHRNVMAGSGLNATLTEGTE
jgi:hypothetical protein